MNMSHMNMLAFRRQEMALELVLMWTRICAPMRRSARSAGFLAPGKGMVTSKFSYASGCLALMLMVESKHTEIVCTLVPLRVWNQQTRMMIHQR